METATSIIISPLQKQGNNFVKVEELYTYFAFISTIDDQILIYQILNNVVM